MALTFDPFTELERVTHSMRNALNSPRIMPVDLHRDQERYVLTADMPGADPGSIDVDLDGQLLTIRAYRSSPDTSGVKWLTQERPDGAYVRQFSIGEGIDTEAISAAYKDGVLNVILPLSARAKPRKIDVEMVEGDGAAEKSLTA